MTATVPIRFLKGVDVAKTFKNLWPSLISAENCELAYRRCRRRKRYSAAAVRFDFNRERNLIQLRKDLADQTWEPGSYTNFRIHYPKPRLISAAPFQDRVVHHAIVNILEPIFERRFIFDSYACRRGKGTHRAIRRAQYYLRRHRWYLKTDIVRFFPSIDHKLLDDQLRRVVADEKVMHLVNQILASGLTIPRDVAIPVWFPHDDLFAPLRPKGLPIGNLTSQFLANVFLDPLDHFIKEQLRVPGYIRYADDLLLFGDCRESLWRIKQAVCEQLGGQRLQVHPAKTIVAPSRHGVQYLGFRVLRDQIRMSQRGIQGFHRLRKRLQYEAVNGRLTVHDATKRIAAWQAHARVANSLGIRRTLMSKIRLRFRSR